MMEGAQWDFVTSEARHAGFITGRGAGKTVGSVVKAFTYALSKPGSRGCQTAPTYQMTKDVLIPEMNHVFGETKKRVWDIVGGNEPKVMFANGSELYLRPALEPDRLRGLTLAYFGMDECTIGNQSEAFLILQGCLRQESYPHQGWVTGTPKGVRHWTYWRWGSHTLPSGSRLDTADYPMFWADARYNSHNPEGFVDNLLTSYGAETQYARQEIEGRFVELSGQVYPMFDEKKHVRPMPVDLKARRRLIGLDIGVRAPTAAVEVLIDERNRAWASKEFYKRNCDTRELIAILASWNPVRVICDPTAKADIEELRRAGMPTRKAKDNFLPSRIRAVGARLADAGGEPGLYITPECPNLIEELASLAYARSRMGEGIETEHFAPGMADHAQDALGYALMEIEKGAQGPPPNTSVRYSGW